MNVFRDLALGRIANTVIAIVSAILLLFNVSEEKYARSTLDLTGYELVFEDEFDGSRLDSAVWSPQNAEGVRKGGFWTMDETEVADGYLTIKTEYKEDGKFGAGWYTAGISTRYSFSRVYGYYECRCKLPKGEGLWSAFWMTNPSVGKVTGTAVTGAEIDIFESPYYFLGYPFHQKVTHNIHYNGYDLETRYSNVGITQLVDDPYETFNTYGMLWTEEGYTFYVNGKEVGHSSYGGVSTAPEYMILSCEVDGAANTPMFGWSGNIEHNGKDFSAEFVVDYVKVYALK